MSTRRGEADGDFNDIGGEPTGPPPRPAAPSRLPSSLRSSHVRASLAPAAGTSERERTAAEVTEAGDGDRPDPLPERGSGRNGCGRWRTCATGRLRGELAGASSAGSSTPARLATSGGGVTGALRTARGDSSNSGSESSESDDALVASENWHDCSPSSSLILSVPGESTKLDDVDSLSVSSVSLPSSSRT